MFKTMFNQVGLTMFNQIGLTVLNEGKIPSPNFNDF